MKYILIVLRALLEHLGEMKTQFDQFGRTATQSENQLNFRGPARATYEGLTPINYCWRKIDLKD